MQIAMVKSWSQLSADIALSPKITSAPFLRWLPHPPCDRRHLSDAGHTRHKVCSDSLYGDLPDMMQGVHLLNSVCLEQQDLIFIDFTI